MPSTWIHFLINTIRACSLLHGSPNVSTPLIKQMIHARAHIQTARLALAAKASITANATHSRTDNISTGRNGKKQIIG